MHPLATIIMLSAVASVLQTFVLMWLVHCLHVGTRYFYWFKLMPLCAVNLWFFTLAVRILIWG